MSPAIHHGKTAFCVILGSFLSAVAMNAFIIPNKLLSGGVSGLAILAHYLTGAPTGIVVFVLNIPIFIIGYRYISKNFAVLSLLGMSALSLFLIITKPIAAYAGVDDVLLCAIYGGVIHGIGMGLVFRNGGSQGGTDILAVVLKKYISIDIGKTLFGINVLIVSLSSFLFGLKLAMLTLISMFIASTILDKIQHGFAPEKSVMIISDRYKQIADNILKETGHGVTFLQAKGAYTEAARNVIFCVVPGTQLAKIKAITASLDRKAFIIVNDTSEVLGAKFTQRFV